MAPITSGTAADSATPGVSASPQPSGSGLSEAEAIELARQAVPPEFADGDVRNAKAAALTELFPAIDEFEWSRDLSPDLQVWSVFLVTEAPEDENGAMVILDYADGTVYHVSTGFAD